MRKTQIRLLLVLTLGFLCASAYAQEDESPAADLEIPADEFDRGTPLRSAEKFLIAVDVGDYEKAAEHMDLRNLRGEARDLTGAQLARRFNVIVKRATWIDIDELVDDPDGRSNDNLPDYRDSIGVVLDEDKEHRMLMQKVPRGDGVFIWKISNASVSLIPKLYSTYGYPKVIEDLRRNTPDVSFLGWRFVCASAYAQEDESPAADLEIPADEFDRGTPLRSAEKFLIAVDVGDYEKAAEHMDLRNLRGEARDLTGAQLARRFNVIVKRATWIDIDELVDDPDGRSNDNLPDYRDSIGVVLDEDKEHRMLMQKVPRGDGVFIWKISNASVSLIPKLYSTYGYPKVIEDLRRNTPDVSFLGYELFKWVVVLVVGGLVYIVVFLTALGIRRILGDPDAPSNRRIYNYLVRPFGIWVVLITVSAVAESLGRGVRIAGDSTNTRRS